MSELEPIERTPRGKRGVKLTEKERIAGTLTKGTREKKTYKKAVAFSQNQVLYLSIIVNLFLAFAIWTFLVAFLWNELSMGLAGTLTEETINPIFLVLYIILYIVDMITFLYYFRVFKALALGINMVLIIITILLYIFYMMPFTTYDLTMAFFFITFADFFNGFIAYRASPATI